MAVKVSICIPTYNGALYLKECLDSALQQTFKDTEVIISDDFSTDNTIEIIESYVKKDNRIKFYNNKVNLGLVGNWNQCISKANGEWIKFLFQDDYMELDCIEKLISNVHLNQDTQIIVSKRSYILPDNISLENKSFYEKNVKTIENTNALRNGIFISAKIISEITANNISLNFIGEPSFVMFKRDVVATVGLFNDAFSQICDLDFVLQIATRYGLFYVTEQLSHFRIHEHSTTNKNTNFKAYIINNIDPIIMARQLLYSNDYESFRKNNSFFNKVRVKVYFKVRVYEAFLKSKKDAANKTIFENAAARYSEISSSAKANFLIKLCSQIVFLKRKLIKVVFNK